MNSTLPFAAAEKPQVARKVGEQFVQPLGPVASPGESEAKTPLLSLHRLVKCYGGAIAVNELSLTLGGGEVFGFLGPNGAGKTSTIRMLCGLNRPSSGHGTVMGYDIWEDRFQVRSLLGYVPQQFSLYPDLTVLENLWFFASAYGVPRRRANRQIQTLLSQLDLFSMHQKRAGQLSGGFKQLLAIGCALVHSPPLLILDEPTSGLDPTHRQTIWDLLYRLSQEGTTIFVTTHYMDEADRCTKVGFLYGGQLLAIGSPSELKDRLATHILDFEIEPAIPAQASLRNLPGVFGARLRSGQIRLFAREPDALLSSLRKCWPFPGLRWHGYQFGAPDMDDVFEAYRSGQLRVNLPSAEDL
jgi:ABC-2 type transport system ATP-binding protein